MRRLLLALALIGTAMWSGPVLAQDFAKGFEAYERGDYATAVQELRPLAEMGNADAQFHLGAMYQNGLGVIQDYVEAERWLRLAAEQGVARAAFFLSGMYYLGNGVKEDKVLSYMWANIAAALGEKFAASNRNAMKWLLTPAQLAEAQRLSRECVAKDYKGC